jgi:glutaredoxin-like protein NrdH
VREQGFGPVSDLRQRRKMIYVYSQANCPGCNALKLQLKVKGIEFVEVRIDQDAEARQFILDMGHRTVPVIYKDGKHIANPMKLEKEES